MSNQDAPISMLVASILQQQSKDLTFTTNSLIDGLTNERDRLWAELDLVREMVANACEQPYAPNPGYLMKRLFPSQAQIDARVEGMKSER